MMEQHVLIIMNVKVAFVKVEAVALIMAYLAAQLHIVADILLKAALIIYVQNS